MKVKILKQCVVAGKTAKVDAVIETNDKDGKYLIAIGKAEATKAKAKPAKTTEE